MELPTYTNIWKIEKRLYKLYDFRLPMPLPVGQIVAFLAIAIPYTLILTMAGMPFSHTWVWLYVLPPGALAWLVTRPVLEGKRLPELLLSQLRYAAEPRTWCRLAPLAEKDHVAVVARVWRSAPRIQMVADADDAGAAHTSAPAPARAAAMEGGATTPNEAPVVGQRVQVRATASAVPPGADASHVQAGPEGGSDPPRTWPDPAPERVVWPQAGAERVNWATASRPLNLLERALRSSPGDRPAASRHEPMLVVPGGHRPGAPDHLQRDQARARLPLLAPVRIVVLGCTAGAGQTVTTLLTGQLLASLRGEAVAVADLCAGGAGSLTEQARNIPVLLPSRRAGADTAADESADRSAERGLQVVTAADTADDADQIINSVVARYRLTLVDPDAKRVPKALQAADQLVLVAPASPAAPGALAMTLEWLEANDHGQLATTAVVVLNGVRAQAAEHVDKAAAVVTGRCRAIVKVPWDDRLRGQSAAGLGAAAVQAFTAIAGVIIAGLTGAEASRGPSPSGVR